jgi:hypothetical protein
LGLGLGLEGLVLLVGLVELGLVGLEIGLVGLVGLEIGLEIGLKIGLEIGLGLEGVAM